MDVGIARLTIRLMAEIHGLRSDQRALPTTSRTLARDGRVSHTQRPDRSMQRPWQATRYEGRHWSPLIYYSPVGGGSRLLTLYRAFYRSAHGRRCTSWISVFKSAAESRTGHSRQWARRHRRSSGYRVQRPRAPASSEGGLQTQLSRLGVGLDLSVSHRSDRWCGRGIANTSVLSSSSTTVAESAGIEQIIDMTVVVDIAAANAGRIPQTDGRRNCIFAHRVRRSEIGHKPQRGVAAAARRIATSGSRTRTRTGFLLR